MTQLPELQVAEDAAKVAGKILCQHFHQKTKGTIKQDADGEQGLVTIADLESERAIVRAIAEKFPSHSILAEEEHNELVSAEHLWVIDPLDGTNNFAHGISQFAVSIAYYQNGKPYCGVIHDPIHQNLYVAIAGQGSWHNGTAAKVSEHRSLNETMISTGFYYDRGKLMENTLAALNDFFRKQVLGVRRFGAATLDLVSVGLGHFGGHFEFTLSPWDYAAARLFVEEAGGRVTDCYGKPIGLKKCSVLASNSRLHDSMLKIVEQYMIELSE